jgi:hypothetical protein
VGAVLLRLLPQIRPFSSRPHQPGPLSHQARIQKPVRGPEEPGLRCCSAPHPGSPGAGRNSSSAPSHACPQPTLNSQPPTLRPRPGLASPTQSIATPSGEGGPAAAVAPTMASSRAAPGHRSGPANRPGSLIACRPERSPGLGPRHPPCPWARRLMAAGVPGPGGGDPPPELLDPDPGGLPLLAR